MDASSVVYGEDVGSSTPVAERTVRAHEESTATRLKDTYGGDESSTVTEEDHCGDESERYSKSDPILGLLENRVANHLYDDFEVP